MVSGIAHRLVGRQLALLARVPSFRYLALANFGSGVGTWLAFVALTVDVWDRTESGKWVAALLIADFLPVILIGVLAGPLVDRLSRRRLMVASDLVRCAVFLALPFANSPRLIIVLAGVAGFATGFFRPAVYAGLPNLVTDRELPSANALVQSIEAMTTIIGPLLGGILVAASGPDAAYWINSVTFLFSAALLVRIPNSLLQAARTTTAGHWRDLREGFSQIGGSRALLTVLLAWNVGMLANAGVNVAEIKLAKVSFEAGDFGFGLLVGSAGPGSRAREPFGGHMGRAPRRSQCVRVRALADGDRHRRCSAVAECLGGGACCRRLRRRQRHRTRLQRRLRTTWRARPTPRPGLHRPDELELRGLPARHAGRRPLD